MRNRVGFLQPDRLGETHPLDFTLERLATHHAAVFHEIRWRPQFLKKSLRRKQDRKPVSAHLGIVGIEHANARGGVQTIDRPTRIDIHRARIHAHAEDSGEAAIEVGLVEFFDLRFERILARFFHARRGVDVRRHVDVVRTRTQTGFHHGVIRQAHAGIAGHIDPVLLHQRGQLIRLHRVRLHDDEPAFRRLRRELICKNRVHVRQHDPLEAIVFVQFLADDRTHAADTDDHCVCHKKMRSPAGQTLDQPHEAGKRGGFIYR